MLLADLRVDKVWTQAFRSSRVDAALVARQFAGIREAAEAELRQEGFDGVPVCTVRSACATLGQNYEHLVPVSAEPMTDERLQAAFAAFETIHAERYGYRIEGRGDRVGRVPRHRDGAAPEPATGGAGRRRRERRGCDATGPFSGSGELPTSIYRRYGLPPGTRLAGPAILEEFGSTTLVEPGMRVEVLPDGQLLIDTGVA